MDTKGFILTFQYLECEQNMLQQKQICTKIALTKNILLSLLHYTSSKAVA